MTDAFVVKTWLSTGISVSRPAWVRRAERAGLANAFAALMT